MRTYTLLLCFCLMTINSLAQTQKKPVPIDISNMLSYSQFEDIKTFVLSKGQTNTYCNMYNDNPFYTFGKIELYLNPDMQFPSEESVGNKEIYNEIVLFRTDYFDDRETSIYPFQYTTINADNKTKKVYLVPYWDTNKTMKQRMRTIDKILKNITDDIHKLH